MKAGFLSVETAKTGERVDIPIFPMLTEELVKAKAKAKPGDTKFCFPAAAEMYQTNPDGITWRVKQVLARALEAHANPPATTTAPAATPGEVRELVEAYLTRLGETPRASRIRAVFEAYAGGAGLKEVITATGASRGAVSNYLNELERETGCSILRGARRAVKTDGLQENRENGQRRASLHDFHSLRVTWITIALAAGVPLELVQRVTGHRTVAVVLKHYFRPGREDFRQLLTKAMPEMLGGGPKGTARDEMRAILLATSAKTWRADTARILKLLERG